MQFKILLIAILYSGQVFSGNGSVLVLPANDSKTNVTCAKDATKPKGNGEFKYCEYDSVECTFRATKAMNPTLAAGQLPEPITGVSHIICDPDDNLSTCPSPSKCSIRGLSPKIKTHLENQGIDTSTHITVLKPAAAP